MKIFDRFIYPILLTLILAIAIPVVVLFCWLAIAFGGVSEIEE